MKQWFLFDIFKIIAKFSNNTNNTIIIWEMCNID